MLLVGLTGGIASGKSLVSGVFRRLGAHIIDADRIVHDLLSPDEPAWNEIVAHFGPSILSPDRTIDRRRLGSIVFGNEQERGWLNALLHPRVFEAYHAQVKRLCADTPDRIIVFDAALLIETGYHARMDKVVVVYATEDQQRERLMQRNGFTETEVRERMVSQIPLAEKRGYADHVIENTGDRDDTERQARDVYAALLREASLRP